MASQPGMRDAKLIASLEHLTGAQRGRVTWVGAARVDILLRGGTILAEDDPPTEPSPEAVARLSRTPEGYALRRTGEAPVWVNRRSRESCDLRHHDIVEFGETGPMTRVRLFREDRPERLGVDEILGDVIAYLRNSRRPMGARLRWALGDLARRLTWRTTILFRLGVLAALVVLGGLFWQQYRQSVAIETRMAEESARLEEVSAALGRAREEALRPADLAALREEFGERVVSNLERLEALERRSEASARVIMASLPAIAFLQGAYALRDAGSGRMLRHAVGPGGRPLIGPRGQPLLTLQGEGPVVEIDFTGTGFVVAGTGALVTNRHVARPWETNLPSLPSGATLEPFVQRFIAWLPGRSDPLAVSLRLASETADLAILDIEGADGLDPALGLALAEAPVRPGDTVIVMGYPTGLRSMLAQAGVRFVETLQAAGDTDFWRVAARLAEAGHIVPLASRGIVGQLTDAATVYDAETTHGGSGGPVLDQNGRVVAVNSAILPEFGGSNLGVPVAHLRALLGAAGLGEEARR